LSTVPPHATALAMLTTPSRFQNIRQNERPATSRFENRKQSPSYWKNYSGELRLCIEPVDKSVVYVPRNQASTGLKSDWLKTSQPLDGFFMLIQTIHCVNQTVLNAKHYHQAFCKLKASQV